MTTGQTLGVGIGTLGALEGGHWDIGSIGRRALGAIATFAGLPLRPLSLCWPSFATFVPLPTPFVWPSCLVNLLSLVSFFSDDKGHCSFNPISVTALTLE